jgi:hypothetical protein
MTEVGTYCDGIYYGLQDETTYLRFFPQANFQEYVLSFAEMDFSNKEFAKDTLSVVDDELVVRATSLDTEGNEYTWSYRFDKETYALKKAVALVYKPNGAFMKTQEFLYQRDISETWERVAYNDITAPKEGETVSVTAKYVTGGAVTHSRQMQISKSKNLYASDVENGTDYCVYADAACTQVLADLSQATGANATIYVSEAKEGDIAIRDTKFAQRDNALSSIMEEYGKYYVLHKTYDLEEEKIGEQHWYYDANHSQYEDEPDGETTFDYLERDSENKTAKVINFRENAFYTWKIGDLREFSLVLDKDYKSVLYAYGNASFVGQKIKTPMTLTEEGYVLVTTKQEIGKDYKTSDWSYTFQMKGDKMVLQNIRIEHYNANGNMVSYAEVEMHYGKEWNANMDAYNKLAGSSAGKKMRVDMVIDHRTSQARIVTFNLYNQASISVYPSELGASYAIYRDELATRKVNSLADFGNVEKKDLYVVSNAS